MDDRLEPVDKLLTGLEEQWPDRTPDELALELEREIAFAYGAMSFDDPPTMHWLAALIAARAALCE